MGGYTNTTIRDASGNIIGYQPVTESQPYVPGGVIGSGSANYEALRTGYAYQQNNIVSSSGTYQQGSMQQYDPSGFTPATGAAAISQAMQGVLQQSIYANQNPVQPFQSTVPMRDLSSSAPTRFENMQPYTQYDLQAISEAQIRPGYTPLNQLGDTTTQAVLKANAAMSQVGFNMPSQALMAGRTLEAQRVAALQTPGTRDDRYYGNELQHWGQNYVETSAAYHSMGMKSGVPIPANRFEYQGDLAVEFLKGAPTKSSEYFSPTSGEMSQYLPNGKLGVQQYEWNAAMGRKENVSFNNAIEKMGSSEGQYGAYGNLWGAPATAKTISQSVGITTPTDTLFSGVFPSGKTWDRQTGGFVNTPTPTDTLFSGTQPVGKTWDRYIGGFVNAPPATTIKTSSGVLGTGAGMSASTPEGWEAMVKDGSLPSNTASQTQSQSQDPIGLIIDKAFQGKLPSAGELWESTPVSKIASGFKWGGLTPEENVASNKQFVASRTGWEGAINLAGMIPLGSLEVKGAQVVEKVAAKAAAERGLVDTASSYTELFTSVVTPTKSSGYVTKSQLSDSELAAMMAKVNAPAGVPLSPRIMEIDISPYVKGKVLRGEIIQSETPRIIGKDMGVLPSQAYPVIGVGVLGVGALAYGGMAMQNKTTSTPPQAQGLEQKGTSVGGINIVTTFPTPFRSTVGGNVDTVPTESPSLLSQFGDSLQKSARTTLATIPGGMGLAIASDTIFAVLRKEPTALPFYDLLKPESKPTGVTEEQYNKNLGTYNADLASYNADLSTYQKGGSTDQTMFNSLTSRVSALETTKQSLDAESKTVVATPTILDKIGQVYEGLNVGLAPYSTDVVGIGKSLQSAPDADLKQYGGETVPQGYSDAINFAKGTYVGMSQHPLDIVATYLGGRVLGIGEGVVSNVVARSAMYEGIVPGISTIGRAASTPLAADVFTVGKMVFGTYIVAESGINIISQPTATGKGESFGRTAIQFAGFGAGMMKPVNAVLEEAPNRFTQVLTRVNNIQTVEPNNAFAGRTFFSGQERFSPLQSLAMDARAYATSFEVPANLRATYRDIPRAFREARYEQARPGITETTPARPLSEPDISIAQTIGPSRAPAIREALAEQPHSVLGSVGMEGQKTGLPTGDLIRSSGNVHDLDVRVQDVAVLEQALAARGETLTGIDAKPFESNYPMVAGRTGPGANEGIQRIGIFTRIFGEPIPNTPGMKLPRAGEVQIGGQDYPGTTNVEGYNVQFARKAQAFMQDLVPAEGKVGNVDARVLNEQFRTPKDYYDFQSIGKDLIGGRQAADLQAGGTVPIGTETPATRIFDRMDPVEVNFDFLPQDSNPIIGAQAGVPFQRTMTFGEIRIATENAIISARTTGQPLPSYLQPTPTAPRPYTPGLSRSAASVATASPGMIPSINSGVVTQFPSSQILSLPQSPRSPQSPQSPQEPTTQRSASVESASPSSARPFDLSSIMVSSPTSIMSKSPSTPSSQPSRYSMPSSPLSILSPDISVPSSMTPSYIPSPTPSPTSPVSPPPPEKYSYPDIIPPTYIPDITPPPSIPSPPPPIPPSPTPSNPSPPPPPPPPQIIIPKTPGFPQLGGGGGGSQGLKGPRKKQLETFYLGPKNLRGLMMEKAPKMPKLKRK